MTATHLAQDTFAYAQSTLNGLIGTAQQKSSEISAEADKAAQQAQSQTNAAAKDGQASTQSAEKTLGDLVNDGRNVSG